MIESKLSALREKTTLTKLARASELSRQQVHNIIKGTSLPPLQTARLLAANACRLTGLEVYEPHDFNPNLPAAIKNLCDDVKFIITELKWKTEERGTAIHFQRKYSNDLELLQAMHECVWDGLPVLIHEPSRLIELDDFSGES
jgi:DNA-binding XRE family transcriptional regulator